MRHVLIQENCESHRRASAQRHIDEIGTSQVCYFFPASPAERQLCMCVRQCDGHDEDDEREAVVMKLLLVLAASPSLPSFASMHRVNETTAPSFLFPFIHYFKVLLKISAIVR